MEILNEFYVLFIRCLFPSSLFPAIILARKQTKEIKNLKWQFNELKIHEMNVKYWPSKFICTRNRCQGDPKKKNQK